MEAYGDKAVDVIEKSIARSKAQGSKNVSAKHLPGALVKKAVAKAAPVMRDTIFSIRQDPGYSRLNADTQAKIEEILSMLEDARNKDEEIAQSAKQEANTAAA